MAKLFEMLTLAIIISYKVFGFVVCLKYELEITRSEKQQNIY